MSLRRVASGRDSRNTAQLVRQISEVGPDISEISRRLGQFKESVRYRYKFKLLGRGFAVQGIVDHEKLGLARVVVIADFADAYLPYLRSVAIAMNQMCYVVSYAKTIPDGRVIINASVPLEHVDSFGQLVARLKKKGVLRSVEMLTFDWFRNIPMRTEYYDFNTDRWDFDWFAPPGGAYKAASHAPSQRQSYDYIDLLILKELQIDASRSRMEVARKLKVHYKKLAWHWAHHVVAGGLIKGYRINWMGTRYDPKTEKALHRRHTYVFVDAFARDLDGFESMTLMSRMSKLPFVWAEAAGNHYYAQLALPLEFVAEGLQFIQRAFETVRDRSTFLVEDTSDALAFTFSYQLYDEESSKWAFDPAGVLNGFESLLLKTRRGPTP